MAELPAPAVCKSQLAYLSIPDRPKPTEKLTFSTTSKSFGRRQCVDSSAPPMRVTYSSLRLSFYRELTITHASFRILPVSLSKNQTAISRLFSIRTWLVRVFLKPNERSEEPDLRQGVLEFGGPRPLDACLIIKSIG